MLYLPLIFIFLLVGPGIAAIAFFRRLSTGWHLFLLSLCVFYGISPFLVTWGALGLAKRFGCSAEAIRFLCPSPVWLGDVISGLAMSHWLAIFAIPSAILGAIGLLISELQHQRSRDTTTHRKTIMNRRNHHRIHKHPKTTFAGQLVCPHCQTAFPITWRRYWAAPLGNYRCLECRQLSHSTANAWWVWLILFVAMTLAVTVGVLLVAYVFSKSWLGAALISMGYLAIGLTLDKWLDGHLRHLKIRS